MTHPTPAPAVDADVAAPDFLSDTDVARIWRKVYGGQRFDACEREFAAEIEAAVRAQFIPALSAAQARAEAVEKLLWDDHPECCGNPVVGAMYMDQCEMVCCGCPEPALLNDAQIVATLRQQFPEKKPPAIDAAITPKDHK